MTVLGIDPGLAQTGFGVITAESSRFRRVHHGAVYTDADQETGDRLLKIYRKIREIIQTYRPDMAGVESLFFARNISSAFPVAEAKGVIMLALAQDGVPVGEFPPLEIKQAITGSGRADKRQVQELVRVLLGLQEIPRPDHAADALAAAICCHNVMATRARLR